jgi:hypothetical protein
MILLVHLKVVHAENPTAQKSTVNAFKLEFYAKKHVSVLIGNSVLVIGLVITMNP